MDRYWIDNWEKHYIQKKFPELIEADKHLHSISAKRPYAGNNKNLLFSKDLQSATYKHEGA